MRFLQLIKPLRVPTVFDNPAADKSDRPKALCYGRRSVRLLHYLRQVSLVDPHTGTHGAGNGQFFQVYAF